MTLLVSSFRATSCKHNRDSNCQVLNVPADGTAEADAEKAVRAAAKIAEAAVSKAVQAAALAGLEYMPPSDMQLDTPRVAKVPARCLQDIADALQLLKSTALPALEAVLHAFKAAGTMY